MLVFFKGMGVLGFRDVEFYNRVLLVGDAWRILKNENLLVYKFDTEKYNFFEEVVLIGIFIDGDACLVGWKIIVEDF